MAADEFLKRLIELLAHRGGTFTCNLDELRTLGLELSLQNLSSDGAATLTLRLGARIYYVPATQAPASAQEATWPQMTSPPEPTPPQSSVSNARLRARSVESELQAVASLNNHPPSQLSPTISPDEESSTSQPETLRHVPLVKDDLSLYLIEQRREATRSASRSARELEARNQSREYPWETR